MRLLFVGDVTGRRAVEWLLERLAGLRLSHSIDVVVVDADNADVTGPSPFGGSGLTPATRDLLLAGGRVDLITMGYHAFDGPYHSRTLEHPLVLRAHNLRNRPGDGVAVLQPSGVRVVCLASTRAFEDVTEPWLGWQNLPDHDGPTVVHYLEGNNYEPRLLAYAAGGSLTAVLGTWSHVPSDDLEILPNGTGVVGDVGHTGPIGGIGGFETGHFIAAYKNESTSALPPYQLRDTPLRLSAVLVDIDRDGRCVQLRRVG